MKLFRKAKAYPDKPARYLGPDAKMQAARDAAARTERLARKAAAKKAEPLRRIKARTPQRVKDERTYRKLAKEYLAAFGNEMCQACKPLWKIMHSTPPPDWMPSRASQVHHSHGRRGRLLLHRPFFIPVCEFCHHIITFVSPSAAREAGVLCPEGRYNDQSAIE